MHSLFFLKICIIINILEKNGLKSVSPIELYRWLSSVIISCLENPFHPPGDIYSLKISTQSFPVLFFQLLFFLLPVTIDSFLLLSAEVYLTAGDVL